MMLAWVWCSVTAMGGAVAGRLFPGRRIEPADPRKSLQSRVWNGRIGQWLVRLATFGMSRPGVPAGSAHRPTEIAIGLAADALFEALPRETRKALKDLPAVIRRLEADAQGLRARVDELNALLAGAGEASAGAQSRSLRVGGSQVVGALGDARVKLQDELTAERDGVARRLASSVAALENIRLDLLRLRAGAGTVDQLSADLAAARDIGAEVDAALAGQAEVQRLLAKND
jgi:serine/threonine-protein kinase